MNDKHCEWRRTKMTHREKWHLSTGFNYTSDCGLVYTEEAKEDFTYCPKCGGVIVTKVTIPFPNNTLPTYDQLIDRIETLEKDVSRLREMWAKSGCPTPLK